MYFIDIPIWLTNTAIPAFIATITTTVITTYVNWKMKSNEHVFEYKKYILTKRKEVYNLIEEIISIINVDRVFIPGIIYPSFIHSETDQNPIEELNNKVNQILVKGFWLSDKMFTEMDSLNHLLGEMQLRVDPNNIKKTSFDIAANEPYSSKFKAQAQRISIVFFEDVCTLDDINAFKRKKLFYQ